MKAKTETRENIVNLIDDMHPEDKAMMRELLQLIIDNEKGNNNGAVFVVYQQCEALYHGGSVSAALAIFNQNTHNNGNDLAFFCIYADHSVSIFSGVQA